MKKFSKPREVFEQKKELSHWIFKSIPTRTPSSEPKEDYHCWMCNYIADTNPRADLEQCQAVISVEGEGNDFSMGGLAQGSHQYHGLLEAETKPSLIIVLERLALCGWEPMTDTEEAELVK
jgi:hypothetical protein